LRAGLAILLIAVIGCAVLIGRALSLSSNQIRVERAETLALDEGLAERLAGALRFRTVSAKGEFDPAIFQELHRYLERHFPRVHESLEREIVGECSLLYRWAGRDPKAKPILLMSHLDVVAVPRSEAPRWTHDPWSGAIAKGYIWGRGAIDVKCGVLGQLEAIEHLLGQSFQPQQDVYLAFGHDEEIGGPDGNLQIALKLRQRGVRFRFVLDEGGVIVENAIPGLHAPLALIAVAEKGYATVRMSVDIEPGHSSMPPPQSAVGILAAAVTKLEQTPRPASLSGPVGLMLEAIAPEVDFPQRLALANRDVLQPILLGRFSKSPSLNALTRTTTAVTVFQAGQQENSLPGHAEAFINFRLLPGEGPEVVLQHVKDVAADPRIKIELREGSNPPSTVSDHRSPDFLAITRAIRQTFPEAVVAPGLAVVATDSRHYEPLADNIYRFLPVQLSVEDLKRIHGIDERISAASYRQMVEFLVRLLEETSK
jgi:carboxypeptidase PM20D1